MAMNDSPTYHYHVVEPGKSVYYHDHPGSFEFDEKKPDTYHDHKREPAHYVKDLDKSNYIGEAS